MKFREPPPDQLWLETEPIGVGAGWIWAASAVFALALALVTALAVAGSARTATSAQTAATPRPLSQCFGHKGVKFGDLDAYICEVKLADDPSGALYFMTTLGDTTTGENVVWYKLHPAPGNFWVYETLTPRQDPAEPRDYGRTVQIDEGSSGQCLVAFPSWTVPPTECAYVTDGGTAGPEHPLTPAEQASLAEFMTNMRAAIPLEYR